MGENGCLIFDAQQEERRVQAGEERGETGTDYGEREIR